MKKKIGNSNPDDQKNLQDGSVAGPDRGHKLRLDLCVTQHATVAARTPEDWLRRVEQDGHGFIEWRSLTEQEQAAKSAQDRQARLNVLSPADRRRAARHGLDRAERNAEQRRTTAENTQEPTRPVPRTRAERLQARADRASPPRMQKPKPPLPADRERGKVYITGHEVMGSGEIHTAIEYTPEKGDTAPTARVRIR
ncbi:MAG: hypothetical protein ABF335_11935 [Alphaproteobacteria bacterium]